MLTDAEFLLWGAKCGLSSDAIQKIDRIRKSEPARGVTPGLGTAGRFPSRKMGHTVQFESHKNELPAIYVFEHDDRVLEYYDQPLKIKLNYVHSSGKNLGVLHISDFFLIKEDGGEWVECKMEEELIKLSFKQPNRYHKDENGVWRCPPGERYAAQFGLNYVVRSSAEIDWTFQFNIEFLGDYYRNVTSVRDASRQIIHQLVTKEPGVSIHRVINSSSTVITADDVFALIVEEEIFVDLRRTRLTETREVMLFSDRVSADAYDNIHRFANPADQLFVPTVDLVIGCKVVWDDATWKIANVGAAKITLLNAQEQMSDVPLAAFSELVRLGAIKGIKETELTTLQPAAMERYQTADSEMLERANQRKKILDEISHGDGTKVTQCKRTIKRWQNRAEQAKENFGVAYLGLIPKRRSGNGTPRLDPDSEALMIEVIERKYENIIQPSRRATYGFYLNESDKKALDPASYATFRRRANERDIYKQTLARQGKRAAYKHMEWHWTLKNDTPQHGSHPFHIVHIDHTEVDLQLNDSITGKNFGRAWLTLMIDAYSRRILAFHLSYNSPSKVACMETVRECVRRYGRLPQNIVVDGGKEFGSEYLEALLAMYEITKKVRPPAESRNGSPIERMFGTANSDFFHNLQGNTQIMKNVRQVTKSVNPANHAIYTLPLLAEYLAIYLYEIYDTKIHSTLGESPREAFLRGIKETGERKASLIGYTEDFEMLTMPEIPRKTALVKPGRGIRINHLDYFCDAFRDPRLQNNKVSVRFDPWNAGRVLVYVHGRWTTCLSNYRHTFEGRSIKEIELATKELHRRRGAAGREGNVTAKQLAHFIESVEGEAALRSQQISDRETKWALQVLQGGLSTGDIDSGRAIPVSVNGANPLLTSSTTSQRYASHVPDADTDDNVVIFPDCVTEYETF